MPETAAQYISKIIKRSSQTLGADDRKTFVRRPQQLSRRCFRGVISVISARDALRVLGGIQEQVDRLLTFDS